MRFIARRECHHHDVYRPHAQLLPGAKQTDTAHIADGTFAGTARKDAVKVRYGEARKVGKAFSIEGFVKVLADIALHFFNSLLMNEHIRCCSSHNTTISFFVWGGVVLSYHVQILLFYCATIHTFPIGTEYGERGKPVIVPKIRLRE